MNRAVECSIVILEKYFILCGSSLTISKDSVGIVGSTVGQEIPILSKLHRFASLSCQFSHSTCIDHTQFEKPCLVLSVSVVGEGACVGAVSGAALKSQVHWSILDLWPWQTESRLHLALAS